MSTFFQSQQPYKPQIRQEGFHLPSPSPSNTTPPPNNFDSNNLFITHNFLPDAFRKFPNQQPENIDFTDELASLIANPQSTTTTSHERSTHSPPSASQNTFDDAYRSSHNLFDIQNHHNPHSPSSSSAFPPHFPVPASSHRPPDLPLSQPQSSQSHLHSHHPAHSLHDFTSAAAAAHHFSAINSAIRYDHHPDQPPPPPPPPPSSFPTHFRNKTPSPIGSRSRSQSRAPSVPPTVGPTRTTRTRRNNSVSSTSPPPHPPARPQAIVIPSSHRTNGSTTTINGHPQPVSPLSLHSLSGSNNAWYIPSHSTHSSEYSLPTPESLTHSHHSHSLSHPGFTPFALSHSRSNSGPTPQGSVTGNGMATAPTGTTVGDKQALLANEKRRRRRESHNAVERRRRDNINEKISELATLIPECMLDPTCPSAPANGSDDPLLTGAIETKKEDNESGEGGVVKANKGMILRKSVEYIRYLQQIVTAQATRNRELEQQLSAYRSSPASVSVPASDKPLSASSTNGHVQTQTPPPSDSPDNGSGGGPDMDHGEHRQSLGKRDDEMGMMLHEEVVGEGFGVGGFGLDGMGLGFGVGVVSGGFGKGMFELASMPEGSVEDMEVEDGEGRPSTGVSIRMSPSVGSAEGSEEREEEERGRRGRDGRVRGLDDGKGLLGMGMGMSMGMGMVEKIES